MTGIETVILEAPDPAGVEAFVAAAFGPELPVRARPGEAATTGFRGFTLSLVVSRPSTVDAFVEAALKAGGSELTPPKKSLWGYGGGVTGPDGTIWTVASSSKKDRDPKADQRVHQIEEFVLQLGVDDVAASKRFYVERGLQVAKSFGRKYVSFSTGPITLALLSRRALAKNAGVSADGTGSHRIVVSSPAGTFTDPDGFTWETAR
ncbi:glyoxalase [Mycolicibacterium holsaticum]|uniref:Glyoxalase n=1 Tax=Mycolicibacterium holsaticum TaxID=152142 RepID=A0A1E3R3F7_9MYCO|nr:glyoxalase [Mycolicibacterium holsaticum]ODQ84448.1 glyoxalase [Mycolicibacterium holsaticum]